MQKKKRSQWRKLDNAAQAFPAATGKKDTRVFRLYCELKEDVIEEVLQKAVECTLEKYPLYCSVLRKGLFWFYMEQRNLKPKVKAEDRPPCSGLYVPDQKSFLFEVSYYKKKINLEVFHCLTDGTGALNFLKELVRNYLMICYPQVEFPPVSEEEISTASDHEEDSFSQYYSKSDYGSVKKSRPAFQLKGERLEQEEMSVLEVVLSAKEVYRKAKSYGVSVTVFLSAALLCAIHEEMPRSQMKKPVTLMVPVNLRNYFPSYSMTNFFGWIEAGQVFEENTRFEEVLQNLQHVFRTELVKERIADNMNRLVRLEKNPLLRAVPLEIKNLFLLAGTTLGGRSISAIYSNIGKIQLPDVFETYVDSFGFFTSTDKLQMCSCSYGDKMRVGITSKILSHNIQRNFLRILKEEGIHVTEQENDFPGYKEKKLGLMQKSMQIFTFLCIAAVVISWVVNLMLPSGFLWAGFVSGGVLCTWLFVMVGYKKRRNLLKNGMWQLLLISAAGLLWDVFTGWHGWAVDFVLPLASLVILAAMTVVARVCRLEENEYLFYLVQIGAFGCIPGILLAAGAVRIRYPSLLCTGISILLLAGIVVFRGKSFVREIKKKFRV